MVVGTQKLISQYGTITLRSNQVEAKDAIYDYFYQGNSGNPLIVVPTGGGKSLIIAAFIYETLARWPDQRILVASHVKEIISQDFDALRKVWPRPDAGIYSASLGQRRFADAVTFATVQSIAKKAHIIGRRNIFIIDEAHLLSDDDNSQYRKLITGLLEINPDMKVIGFTASPYRLGQGYLYQGETRYSPTSPMKSRSSGFSMKAISLPWPAMPPPPIKPTWVTCASPRVSIIRRTWWPSSIT